MRAMPILIQRAANTDARNQTEIEFSFLFRHLNLTSFSSKQVYT